MLFAPEQLAKALLSSAQRSASAEGAGVGTCENVTVVCVEGRGEGGEGGGQYWED